MRPVALAVLLAVAACSPHVELLPCPPASDGGVSACATGTGPPIRFRTSQGNECTGAIASRVARYALCVCDPLSLSVALTSDAVDTRQVAAPVPHGSAVGTGGDLTALGPLDVGGSLTAAGAGGIDLAQASSVADDLRSGGPVRAAQTLDIGGDAYVAGGLHGLVTVGGTLHVPEGVDTDDVHAQAVVHDSPRIGPPCGCAAPVVNASALVKAAADSNDDGLIGLDPAALDGVEDPRELDLPAGSFYLSDIRTGPAGTVRLRIEGRVALFVGGAVWLGSPLRVAVDPNAELDLVVGGDVTFAGGTFGALDAAARVRMWLASSRMQLTDATSLGAIVYGPNTVVSAAGDLTITGALEARELTAEGAVTLHYDLANLSAGTECGAPAEPPLD